MNKSLTATLKYATTSMRKMLLIAKMVRGKTVDQALTQLSVLPKKSAEILWKVIRSASSNATTNLWLDVASLFVEKIELWKWPKIKRGRFVSRWRVHPYLKHRAFVRVILTSPNYVEPKVATEKKAVVEKAVTKTPIEKKVKTPVKSVAKKKVATKKPTKTATKKPTKSTSKKSA